MPPVARAGLQSPSCTLIGSQTLGLLLGPRLNPEPSRSFGRQCGTPGLWRQTSVSFQLCVTSSCVTVGQLLSLRFLLWDGAMTVSPSQLSRGLRAMRHSESLGGRCAACVTYSSCSMPARPSLGMHMPHAPSPLIPMSSLCVDTLLLPFYR